MKSIFNLLHPFALAICMGATACAQTPVQNKAELSVNDTTEFNRPDSYWKRVLSNQQYYVLREKGTEKPFSGKWLLNNDSGTYTCAGCGNPLFDASRKFDAHCGWPSFDEEIAGGKITTRTDQSHGMSRTEINCARCGGHLGHLFDDGPSSTGKRYCVNSLSLEFTKQTANAALADTLTLGGGCFWCIEAVFEKLEGVLKVESGYSGGVVANPSYEAVCSGNTGHAEVVQIIFDPNQTSTTEILKVFFTVHDPCTMNRQGADVGSQYRSVVFYRNAAQKATAVAIIDELSKSGAYRSPIVTAVEAFSIFYAADSSHQDYYRNNPNGAYCRMVIQPKMEKFEKVFKDRIKAK